MGNLFRSGHSSGLAALGVDVGSGCTKFARLDQSMGRIDVTAIGSVPVEPGSVDNGIIRDPRKFGKSLASQLHQSGISTSATVVSIPSNLASLRWVQLPDLEGEDLRDAAKYKVKRHLTFPIESAYIEATRPDIQDGETMGASLVIAVPREVIDSRADAIEAAGHEPVGAELEAQAILRIVERRMSQTSALWRDASLTIIDVGANNTHMYVIQNQQLQFIRGVKFGSQKIAEALARELDLTVETASKLMSQPDTELWGEGICKVKVGDVYQFVYVSVDMEKLVREFLRLLRYFRSLHPERSYAGILDHVLICGGLASMPGFAEYLEAALELRVERARPFQGMVAKLKSEAFLNIASNQEAYTVVVGLALSGLQSRQTKGGINNARHEYSWSRSA